MKLSWISVGVCALAGVLAQTRRGNELDDIFRRMKSHPDGLVHAGLDGILRSFDGEGKVIDFAGLDSHHLRTAARWFPEQKERLTNVWQFKDRRRSDLVTS